MDPLPVIQIRPAQDAQTYEQARELFLEYAQSLPIDLEFQDFAAELVGLPGEYAEPHGCILLAYVDDWLAGCCALRPLAGADYSNACEMRRLYVRKPYRGFGLGRMLAHGVMEAAQLAGYSHILLDTLDEMGAARALYEELGFEEIEPYYYTPHADTFFLKADLR